MIKTSIISPKYKNLQIKKPEGLNVLIMRVALKMLLKANHIKDTNPLILKLLTMTTKDLREQ
jgi:hypothetical protein